jgi:uncharacterized membrane-anchored protein
MARRQQQTTAPTANYYAPNDPGVMTKRKVHVLLPALTVLIGGVLLTYMVSVESEPGAIPLLLIALGSGWYFLTRYRFRSRST